MKNFSPETINVVNKIANAEKIVIYGAKKTAEAMIPVCESLADSALLQIAVTNLHDQDAHSLCGYMIQEIANVVIDSSTLVLVAMNRSLFAQVSQIPQLKSAADVLYIDIALAAEVKRCTAIRSLKQLGIDLRLFEHIYSSDIFGRTNVSEPFFHSVVEKMWLQAAEDSARYATNHMRAASVFPHLESYHSWLKDTIHANQLPGGINFEFGVASGVSLRKFAGEDVNIFYGFDSFDGLPVSWFSDGSGGMEQGHFKINGLPQVPERVELIKGWFHESLPAFILRPDVQDKKADFIHIDCDLYESAKAVFRHIHSFVRKGTIIAFDEYMNYPGWQEDEFKAFQEYVKEHNVHYEYLAYNDRGSQVCCKIIDFQH